MEHFRDVLQAVAYSSEKLKKVTLFDTAHLFCDVYGLNPGQSQAAHVHRGSDKVYFVLTGKATFVIDGEEREVGPGHAVLAPAGATHGVRNASNESLALLVVMTPRP